MRGYFEVLKRSSKRRTQKKKRPFCSKTNKIASYFLPKLHSFCEMKVFQSPLIIVRYEQKLFRYDMDWVA